MEFILKQLNELTHKEKQYGLTTEEKNKQEQLRKKYAGLFRSSMEYVLLHTTIIDANGEDVTPTKLKRMKQLVEEMGTLSQE